MIKCSKTCGATTLSNSKQYRASSLHGPSRPGDLRCCRRWERAFNERASPSHALSSTQPTAGLPIPTRLIGIVHLRRIGQDQGTQKATPTSTMFGRRQHGALTAKFPGSSRPPGWLGWSGSSDDAPDPTPAPGSAANSANAQQRWPYPPPAPARPPDCSGSPS